MNIPLRLHDFISVLFGKNIKLGKTNKIIFVSQNNI